MINAFGLTLSPTGLRHPQGTNPKGYPNGRSARAGDDNPQIRRDIPSEHRFLFQKQLLQFPNQLKPHGWDAHDEQTTKQFKDQHSGGGGGPSL